MLIKQAESAGNQQNFVQPGDYQGVASMPANPTPFVNQAQPFEATVPGHEEVMDHSGVYDAASQQVFSVAAAAARGNAQLSQQGMPPAGQVLMDISSENPTGDYSFDYGNVMQGQSFTAQLQQPMPSQASGFLPPDKQHPGSPPVQSTVLTSPVEQPQMVTYSNPQRQYLQSPLEEIQAQQLASRSGAVLSPTQFVSNMDLINSSRQTDVSSQPRKGRLPRNVSDSQLYTMDLTQLGTSFQTNLFPSMESNLPPQLEAPNLVAHLQSIQPRTRLTSTPPAASQAKRARLPRNMSDSKLSSLANLPKSPTSPPSLPTLQSSAATKQHSQPASSSAQPSRLSALKGRKQGRLPRNMSDSSLLSLGQQPQQVPAAVPLQRRRKMSDPQQVLSAAAFAASLQGSVVPSATFTSSAATTQLYSTSGSLQSGDAQLLEQLLSSPAVSSNSPLSVVSSSSTVPQSPEASQSVNSSVIGQLLTDQSPVSTATVQMPAQDSNPLGGSQDPALLSQLYQLKQMLQSKQTSSVPTELVNALNSLTSSGAMQVPQQKQEQAPTVQHIIQPKVSPVQPSLQMKPKNQSAITQALQSLLRAPPNVTLQPSTQNKQNTQVNTLPAQPSHQVPTVTSQETQVPSVTIKHQPQGKPSIATVIITPQGGIQPVQDTRTEQIQNAPELVPTPLPQVVNIGSAAVQGQRIILPANVNLGTLSLAQLGLSPANLQSVSCLFCLSHQNNTFGCPTELNRDQVFFNHYYSQTRSCVYFINRLMNLFMQY